MEEKNKSQGDKRYLPYLPHEYPAQSPPQIPPQTQGQPIPARHTNMRAQAQQSNIQAFHQAQQSHVQPSTAPQPQGQPIPAPPPPAQPPQNQPPKRKGGEFPKVMAAIGERLGDEAKAVLENPKFRGLAKRVFSIAVKVGLGAAGVFLIMRAFTSAMLALEVWLIRNSEMLLLAGLGVVAVLVVRAHLRQPELPPPQFQQAPPWPVLVERAKKQHKLLSPTMLAILRMIAQSCNIVIPTSEADIKGKPPYTVLNDGTIFLHFDLMKCGEVNVEYTVHALRNNLWQRLSAGEIRNINPPFVMFRGEPYSAICVDGVRVDGNLIHIDIVLVDNENTGYLQQLDARTLESLRADDSDVDYIG